MKPPALAGVVILALDRAVGPDRTALAVARMSGQDIHLVHVLDIESAVAADKAVLFEHVQRITALHLQALEPVLRLPPGEGLHEDPWRRRGKRPARSRR